jgi:hypothetical protein
MDSKDNTDDRQTKVARNATACGLLYQAIFRSLDALRRQDVLAWQQRIESQRGLPSETVVYWSDRVPEEWLNAAGEGRLTATDQCQWSDWLDFRLGDIDLCVSLDDLDNGSVGAPKSLFGAASAVRHILDHDCVLIALQYPRQAFLKLVSRPSV